MVMSINQQQTRKLVFLSLAFGFQLVSFYASFEGVNQTFVAQPLLAFVFACTLNLSLLGSWHEFQQNPQVKSEDEDGFDKRRSLALLIGSALLCLSAFLSSIGMYSVLGFKTGAENDSTVEISQSLQRTKEIFNKVKDAAAKNLDAQKVELVKKLDAGVRRLAQLKSEKRRTVVSAENHQLEVKIAGVDREKNNLLSLKPAADDKLTLRERNAEIQTQISNLISTYGVERDKTLSTDDKKILAFDAPINRNLYDQLVSDLQSRKPLALASVVFGVAPDLLAVALMFITTPRKKVWRRIRDAKAWTVRLGREIVAPVGLPVAVAIEIVVNDENQNPLAQLAIPIDVDEEISDEHIREFFPQIVSALARRFAGNFEIRDLPDNWRETLTAGDPLELTAFEIS
jgi:hypothetical protein